MGAAKALLNFGGVTLIEHIVNQLRPTFDEILVVAAPAPEAAVPSSLLHDAGVAVINDERPFAGPLDALARGLDAISNEIAFACGCDQPLITAPVATALVAMVGEHDAAIPIVGDVAQPLCAAYRKRCASALRAMPRLLEFADAPNVRRVSEDDLSTIDPELRSVLNVNTPDEYARALQLAGRR